MTTTTATRGWPLWSTSVTVVVTDPARLDEACAVTEQVLAEVDRAANRFRPDSEISLLRAASQQADRDRRSAPERTRRSAPDLQVTLGPTFARLLRVALDAARDTGGLVVPTVGGALDALGYDRDITLVVRDGAPVRAVIGPVPPWYRLRLNGSQLRLPAGVLLDLGATAKAAAADWAAAAVARQLGTGVLVSLGGDVATAGPAPAGGWQVLVQDGPSDPASRITLPPGTGLATSSTARRVWRQGGRVVHHLLDPRTGQPARSPWRSVTVAAATCVAANTASTASVAAGSTGRSWLAAKGLPARLVHRDGSVLTLSGWPVEAEVA